MAVKVNLDVVDFEKEIKRVEREIAQLANLEINERIEYATDTLRVVTPVDTGEAREGWENIKYKENDGYLAGEIVNEVEHIVYLNNGHSQQAPRYFIEQVLVTVGVLTPDE
jgi:hypothetical protein